MTTAVTDFEQLAKDTGLPPELADHILDVVYVNLRDTDNGASPDLGELLKRKFANQWTPGDGEWDGVALAAASALGERRDYRQ